MLEPMRVIKVDGRAGNKPASFNEVFGKTVKTDSVDSVQSNKEFEQLQNYK